MASTIPVILSGGAGTRLWPLSRPSTPKQLQSLLGPETMLQSTLARVNHLDGRMVIVANVNSLDAVAAQIRPDLPRLLIGEPVGRNTAPAVAAAALTASPDDVLLVLPADHHIANVPAFHLALDSAVEAARQGRLVTFGVVPTRPETGFGYIVPAPSDLEGPSTTGALRTSIGGGPPRFNWRGARCPPRPTFRRKAQCFGRG